MECTHKFTDYAFLRPKYPQCPVRMWFVNVFDERISSVKDITEIKRVGFEVIKKRGQ